MGDSLIKTQGNAEKDVLSFMEPAMTIARMLISLTPAKDTVLDNVSLTASNFLPSVILLRMSKLVEFLVNKCYLELSFPKMVTMMVLC